MYKYQYRPGDDAGRIRLDFAIRGEINSFINDLLDALKCTTPQISGAADAGMNGECRYVVHSQIGEFALTTDPWGLATVYAEENRVALEKIGEILSKDVRFEIVESITDYNK